MLRYLDIVLLVAAAPIVLLIGVPAAGYLTGAGAWIVLRAASAGVERVADSTRDPNRQITLRVTWMIVRLFLLALAVIIARKSAGRDAGIAGLATVVFAYTVGMGLSFLNRPRRGSSRSA